MWVHDWLAVGTSQACPGTLNAKRSQSSRVYLASSGYRFSFFETPPCAFQITECHPAVLTHGIYRLDHDASLCVEHLPPSILTMILPGGTVIIPISKMEKLSPRDSGHMEVSSRAGIQYLACDSRVYPMQPPSLPYLLGGTLSPIKLANSF